MPPRKQKLAASSATRAGEDDDLDALLDAAIRENQGVAGSPAALRLEQEQREAREKAEAEAGAAQCVCGSCGAGQAKLKCSVCETVRYCGEECEAAHWPEHKLRCLELKAAAAAAEAKGEHDLSHNPDTEAGNCWTCGADNPRSMCPRCKVTKYCGVACQTENWPIHKGRCADMKSWYASIDRAKGNLRKVKGGARRSQEQLNQDMYNASMLGRCVDIERIIAAGGSVHASSGCVNSSSCQMIGPLQIAAQEGHARAVGVLVRHGAQVDARDDMGQTALNLASVLGQLKAVAALLELGALIDSRDNRGFCPLHLASQNGHLEVVALLLEHGAQVDSRNNEGASALYLASQYNYPEVVALLLGKGAQVDLPCKEGATAFFNSAINGHVAVTKLLLQAGADPLHRSFGITTLSFANAMNHPEIVALLQARIAELARARP